MLKDEITGAEEEVPVGFQEAHTTEKEKLIALLEKHRWNKSRTAKELNITRTTLYKKMEKYGIIP
jgi:transcriptional regulator of acetoin/glycerol metabolism